MHRPVPRRRVLAAALAAAALPAAPAVRAQSDWPARPIRLVMPFSAGSGPDVITRNLARQVAERLGTTIVVENKVGGTGLVGTQDVAKSAPDGYTIGYTNIALPVAQELLAKGAFNVSRDLAPIGGTSRSINVLVVPPQLPARSVAELVALLKAKPGAYSYASGGNGTPAHLAAEVFKRAQGLDVVHVPYKALAAAINDLARGDVHFLFGTSGSVVPAIQGNRLRALAIAGPRRLPALPEVPTMAEAGFPGIDVQSWAGLVAPRGTPAPIVARIGQALREVLAEPETVRFLEANGSEAFPIGSAEFGQLLASESERWSRFVKETGLKVD